MDDAIRRSRQFKNDFLLIYNIVAAFGIFLIINPDFKQWGIMTLKTTVEEQYKMYYFYITVFTALLTYISKS